MGRVREMKDIGELGKNSGRAGDTWNGEEWLRMLKEFRLKGEMGGEE